MSNAVTLFAGVSAVLLVVALAVRLHARAGAGVKRFGPTLVVVTRRSDYFALGTGFLVVIGVLVSLNGNFYNASQAAHPVRIYSFWTAPEMDACYILLPMAFYCFIAGFLNLNFPPWVRPGFPNLEIDINRIQHRGHPVGDRSDLWIALYLRIGSREADRNASISLHYRAKLNPDTERGQKFGETLFLGDIHKEGPDDFPTEWLAQPLNIVPQHSYGGYYVARVDSMWRSLMVEPYEESLLIEDHNSDRAVAIPITTGGRFHSGNWVTLEKDDNGYWTIYPALEDSEPDDSA